MSPEAECRPDDVEVLGEGGLAGDVLGGDAGLLTDDLGDDGQDVVLALLSHGGSFGRRDGASRFRDGAVTR